MSLTGGYCTYVEVAMVEHSVFISKDVTGSHSSKTTWQGPEGVHTQPKGLAVEPLWHPGII